MHCRVEWVHWHVGKKDMKTEFNRKCIISGSMAAGSASAQMCGLSLAGSVPSGRLQAWFRAVRHVNLVPYQIGRRGAHRIVG